MRVLVTGSSGLIGSAVVEAYCSAGHEVVGVDNDMRAAFFGPQASTRWQGERLAATYDSFRPVDLDIRNAEALDALFAEVRPDFVAHCAAQPSHDLAARMPRVDWDVNATGTLNVLESLRHHCPNAVMVFMSTNKVYGDNPNRLALVEEETRYDFADPAYREGIPESMSIDRCMHSLFGVSKAAADLMAQEYARYFGLAIGVFRGGCLTGPGHSSAQLHGFLDYLAKCAVTGTKYTIFGYRGKQVRDQIHARDVVAAMEAFRQAPRPGAVYNMGGGRENAASLLECIAMIEDRLGRPMDVSYDDRHRRGDHICYYSDLRAFRRDYPSWRLEYSLSAIVDELLAAHQARRVSREPS